jgi:hypothetical protein
MYQKAPKNRPAIPSCGYYRSNWSIRVYLGPIYCLMSGCHCLPSNPAKKMIGNDRQRRRESPRTGSTFNLLINAKVLVGVRTSQSSPLQWCHGSTVVELVSLDWPFTRVGDGFGIDGRYRPSSIDLNRRWYTTTYFPQPIARPNNTKRTRMASSTPFFYLVRHKFWHLLDERNLIKEVEWIGYFLDYCSTDLPIHHRELDVDQPRS